MYFYILVIHDACNSIDQMAMQHIATFSHWRIRRSAPPPFTSEGHTSKRDCSTSLTLTSIASEESKPETSPRDGASAMLAELGTLSYHASTFASHSHFITPLKIKLPISPPPRPDTRRARTASLSTNMTTRSFWKIPSVGSNVKQATNTAKASSSKMMVFFPFGLRRATWSDSTRVQKNDMRLPKPSYSTPPKPSLPSS